MGKFSKSVRRNQIAGPNQKGFDRLAWISAFEEYELDEQDIKLIEAGLLFDNILTKIRHDKDIARITLDPLAIVRLLLAISTLNLFNISKNTPWDEMDSVAASTILEHTIELKTGQSFSPDELLTGMGDGLKHILRELLQLQSIHTKDEYFASKNDIALINLELNMAIVYQCAVEYWLDCVGNGYALIRRDDGIVIAPQDEELEIARIVSTYRRLNLEVQNIDGFHLYWENHISHEVKRKLCKTPLVSRVYGKNTIEKIELGLNSEVLKLASVAIGTKILIEQGYYGNLLKTPLPNFANFNLDQIIDGWRLLHSLASTCFDNIKASYKSGSDEFIDANSLLKFSTRVSEKILVATFAKALNLKPKRSKELINVFVFTGSTSQEIWSQPIIFIDEYYYPIISALTSVHLLRIIESWMRQGGLDLELRGKEFEKYCIYELTQDIAKSSIRDSVFIHSSSFKFDPPKQRNEEIDIIIAIEDTVLLIEAKCILWPDDSLQFANYRDTIEKAASQIKRKSESVTNNLIYFAECLEKLGHKIKPKKILSCVLTNSAVYSGFPIDGIPIVDLSILGTFFRNELIKSEFRSGYNTVTRHAIKFYSNSIEASDVLESFILSPPQLSDTKSFVKSREVIFPMEDEVLGPLIHKTFKVEIDVDEMMKRHDEHAVNVR
jgi:hypothetical protein